jgi:hypothetical protein
MRRVVRFLVAPVVWWAHVPEGDPLRQTAWQRGKAEAAEASQEHPFFGVLVTVVPAALAAAYIGNGILSRILVALLTGAIGYCVVPIAWACLAALRAPYRQRDEARAFVGDARNLKARVLLERYLMAIRDANQRALEDVRKRGLMGPLEEDAFGEVVTPWFGPQNDQLRLQLEFMGFAELIPELVLEDPPLSTWEEVQRAAWAFARNVNRVLEGDFFEETKKLDRL